MVRCSPGVFSKTFLMDARREVWGTTRPMRQSRSSSLLWMVNKSENRESLSKSSREVKGPNVSNELHEVDGSDGFARPRVSLDDNHAFLVVLQIDQKALDYFLDRVCLVFSEGLERRQLEQITVFDLGDCLREEAIGSEFAQRHRESHHDTFHTGSTWYW